jgi:hypothetical protein
VLAELEVSDELRGVLTRALALEPGDRFGTPEEMASMLMNTPEGEASRSVSKEDLLVGRDSRPGRDRLVVLPSLRGGGAES